MFWIFCHFSGQTKNKKINKEINHKHIDCVRLNLVTWNQSESICCFFLWSYIHRSSEFSGYTDDMTTNLLFCEYELNVSSMQDIQKTILQIQGLSIDTNRCGDTRVPNDVNRRVTHYIKSPFRSQFHRFQITNKCPPSRVRTLNLISPFQPNLVVLHFKWLLAQTKRIVSGPLT